MNNFYALSRCIANLGVDPLFSFAAFLFFPDFLSFCRLLVLVCVVFDAISKSLSSIYSKIFLSIFPEIVKVFLITSLCATTVYAQKKDIFLSKGEQIELFVSPLKHFSVGNKEVIKYKYLPKKNKLLIKGKGQGFSDIITWGKDGKKTNYHIYITSKKEQLKKMEIAQILKGTGLKTRISGDIIYVSGTLITTANYLIVKNLEQQKLPNLIFNISLGKKIKNKIIAIIYNELYARNFEYVYCNNTYAQIICRFQSVAPDKVILKQLHKKYHIVFKDIDNKSKFKNYKIEFKILSIEKNDIDFRDSGLNRIENNLAQLINSNQSNLKTGRILLEDNDITIKLVATPEIITIPDQNFNLQVGGEIPFSVVQNNQQGLKWKFVGLQVKGKLILRGRQFLLKHNSKITKPSSKGVAGTQGLASIYITLNKYVNLYSIDIDQSSKSISSIPYINQIPFLRSLFSKKNVNNSHRKITVLARLVEVSS